MSALMLAEAERLYAIGRERTIKYRPVEHIGFRAYCSSLRRLHHSLGDLAGEDYWVEFLRLARRFQYDLSAAPLAFAEPSLSYVPNEPAMRTLVSRTAKVYPRLVDSLAEYAGALNALRKGSDTPLLDEIERISRGPCCEGAVLIRDSRLRDATRCALGSRRLTEGFEVIGPEDLRSTATYASLVVVGAADWFPSHVFNAPRSVEIHVVSYQWYRHRWSERPSFLGIGSGKHEPEASGRECGKSDSAELGEIAWPTIDWESITQRAALAFMDEAEAEIPEFVEARLLLLDGGYAVFLEAKGGPRPMMIDLEESDDSRVRRVEVEAVEPGMLVLLRTEGGGDYIVPIANRILGGRALACREAQGTWKRMLRAEARRSTLLETCLRLLDLGAERADENNLSNWISDRNICTQAKRDFAAIMRLIGMPGDTDTYWAMMTGIRNAHQRAGQNIRQRLLAQVRAVDPDALRGRGTLVFSLPEAEGGQLTAFRIEEIAPSVVRVPSSRIGRPFRQED